MLYDKLTKYGLLLSVNLKTWKTKPVDIELQPRAKPYHPNPHPVIQAHEDVFRKEVERLLQIGVLKR